jgi:tripartite-type tricarboxylate transporter receptor subunit TctC
LCYCPASAQEEEIVMRKAGIGAVLALLAAGWAGGVAAQADEPYPSRPIRFICPYGEGGASDIFSRTIAHKLTEALGQPVVVDNRPGANGGVGTAIAARSEPDGYTLLMGNSGPLAVNPALRKVPYDPIRDFAPITQGTSYQYALVVTPSLPVAGLHDFLAVLKSRPGQTTFGSTGIGGGSHLSGELFNVMTGARSVHVPFAGSAAAQAALLGGQLNYLFDTVIMAVPHVRAARLRALGVTALRRSPALPEVATLDEQGLRGFELTQWQAVLAPAGTPRAIVDRVYREVARALKMPDVIERLATHGGNELIGNTPEEFAQVIRDDLAKYAKLVRAAGIQLQ